MAARPKGILRLITSWQLIFLPWWVATFTSVCLGLVSPKVLAGTSTVTFSYDELGRLRTVQYQPNGTQVSYGFDGVGNRTVVSNTVDTQSPGVPSGLSGTALPNKVDISWSPSTDAGGSGLAGYRIYRGGTQIGTSTLATYSDTTTSGSTAYSYTVAAYDNAGNVSAQSAAFALTTPAAPDTIAPSTPFGLTASAPSSSQVSLSWSASTDAGGSGLAGYRIYRGGTQIGTSTSVTYSDTTTSGSTAYSYTVAAYDNAGNVSAQSAAFAITTADTIAPSTPSGLTGSAPSSSQVSLSWNPSTDTGGSGLADYRIYRGGTQIGTSTSATYSDTTTSGSTAYSYSVAAYDNAGNASAQSAAFAVTPPDTIAPTAPTALTGASSTYTQVNLSWSASTDGGGSGLAGYRIYRGGAQIGTSTSATYSDATTSGPTAYSYAIAAYDNAGNVSAQSAAFVITTADTIAPSTPSSLTGSAPSSSQVNLSWSASSDGGGSALAGYRIYRSGTQIGTSAATTYTDTTTSGSTAYSYTVAAFDNAGNVSAQSAAFAVTTPDTIAPSTPTGLVATVPSPTSAEEDLYWNASIDTGGSGLAGYRIYRGGTLIGTSASNTFNDTTTSADTTYTYSVAAYDNVGNTSPQSAGYTVTTQTNIPSTPGVPAPTGMVRASPWTESWVSSGGPVAYYILSRTIGTSTTTITVNAPTSSYSQIGTNGTIYKFKVQACNSSNQCSAFSAISTVTYCKNGVCP